MGNTTGTGAGPMITGARLDHVAFGVESLHGAAEFLAGTLGGAPHEGGPGPGYTGAQWRFANGARLELIEPLGADGFLHRFIRAKGPGIHHVTFIVPKLELAARAAEALGYEVVGYSDAYPSWKECFLHPKQALGIVVQMVEKSDTPDAGNTWGADFAFPQVKRASSQARIVALRMSAPSREAAMKQWSELLGGELAEPTPDVLEFRWKSSPIDLVVEIDSSLPPGPKHVEVGVDGEVTLPTDPNPSLGTRFVATAP